MQIWRRHIESGIPIDNLCTRLVRSGEMKVAAVLPFLTSVDLETGSVSDVQVALPRRFQRKLILHRSRFFVGGLAIAHSA